MYSLIEKCYGILLEDEVTPRSRVYTDLIFDLMKICDPDYVREDCNDPDSPDMSKNEFQDVYNEISEGQPFIWTTYNGGGVAPFVLGFGIEYIAAFQVSKNPDFFKEPSDELLSKYQQKFRSLFQSYPKADRQKILELLEGHELRVFFTHRTS